MPFILIQFPMFWGTADNTGSDSREPNYMLKDSQSELGYLLACCLSPFSPLLEIGSSKERLGANSSQCPPPGCFAFPFGQKGGRNGSCFSFCSLPGYKLGQTSGVSASLTKFFSSPLLFHLVCFQESGDGWPLFSLLLLFIETTPMRQLLLRPFANKYVTCLKVTLQE